MLRIAVCFLRADRCRKCERAGRGRGSQRAAIRHAYLRRLSCHRAGTAASPNADAPTFPVIAQVPGLTALALTVSLQGAHRQMPDLVLETQERNDVIAFILSLRRN